MILITGGARSGKSKFAESIAKNMGKKVLYIATAVAFDDEMKERIKNHKDTRPKYWDTYEGYLELGDVICHRASQYECILIDCVTIMLTNQMFHFSKEEKGHFSNHKTEQKIMEQIEKIISAGNKINTELILVTNEIGLGVIPESKLGRYFRDIAGKANQILAKEAHTVYFCVSGIPLKIKGEII